MSPTLAKIDGLRFYFYMYDLIERPRAHVGEGNSISDSDAKIWLDDLTVANSGRLNKRAINKALRIAGEHQAAWLEI